MSIKNKLFFLDTSALIALLNRRDQSHEKIKTYLLEQNKPLSGIVSNLVFSEMLTFFSRYGGLSEAIDFLEKMKNDSHFQVIWIDAKLHTSSLEILKKFADQKLSYTDATSFAIMKKFKVSQVLCFDDDFLKAGFQVLPNK